MIEIMDKSIENLTDQFKGLLQSKQLNQANLIECPLKKPIIDVVTNVVSLILCSTSLNCGICKSCLLLTNSSHPDLIQLPNTEQSIKVADIRELTHYIYQAPKIATYRVVVIKGVDNLNRSAANALLKILEEPPKQVVFILTCHAIDRVIATIRSRTVYWRLPFAVLSDKDWMSLAKWLAHDEGKQQLLTDKTMVIAQINAIYNKKEEPFDIAQSWQQYPIYDLLWFLYLLHGWALRQNYSDRLQGGYFSDNTLLLKQICQIHTMIKLAGQGITLNNLLMCETFLMACRGLVNE